VNGGSPDFEHTDEMARELGYQAGFRYIGSPRTKVEIRPWLSESECLHPGSPEQASKCRFRRCRLQHAIGQGKHILVWGDFDVDGQTAHPLVEGRN
jgi:hypothetical protein